VEDDIEAKARAIERAARQRKPLPRGLWIAAILVSVVCVIGLVVAWVQDRHTVALKPLDRPAPVISSGLWIGLLLGLGLGIAIGSLLAARAKK
jgi:F0F1-type ATP synthase membrane subunit c/vacuolar-type H+-ATPase subunit K